MEDIKAGRSLLREAVYSVARTCCRDKLTYWRPAVKMALQRTRQDDANVSTNTTQTDDIVSSSKHYYFFVFATSLGPLFPDWRRNIFLFFFTETFCRIDSVGRKKRNRKKKSYNWYCLSNMIASGRGVKQSKSRSPILTSITKSAEIL